MKKIRILAIVDLVLVLLSFIFMVVMLFLGINAGFIAGGTALIVFLIIGFLLKAARNRHEEREKAAEEGPEEAEPAESLSEKAKITK